MKYLIYALAFIGILVLFMTGFLIKRSEVREKNFVKKINKHFWHKYIILMMLASGILFLCISYVITILNFIVGKYLLLCSFFYILISMEWAYLFMRIDIYFNISKVDVVNGFISFFANSNVSVFKYSEIVTWFSLCNHNYFLQKNSYEEGIDGLISKLELFLKPSINGLCLAYYHKEYFMNLCKKIDRRDIKEKIDNIIQAEEEIRNTSPEKNKLFHLVFDRNILSYLIIIGLHVIASILVSKKELINFIGNLLFYLPSDILIILVYKGIVKDK